MPKNPLVDVETDDDMDLDMDEEELEQAPVVVENPQEKLAAAAKDVAGKLTQGKDPHVDDETMCQLSIRMRKGLRKRAKKLAAAHELTISILVTKGLEMILDQLEGKFGNKK